MVDRPIIFSSPMVRALLAGRKTQTRRLATSPLRRVQPGDRLYVREAWSHTGEGVWTIEDARRHILGGHPIYRAEHEGVPPLRWWPSLHMPREFSRLTLIVDGVKLEPLQDISEADGEAEGCVWDSADGLDVWYVPGAEMPRNGATAAKCYSILWDSLHTKPGERWQDNPHVVALTFRVVRGNIDKVPA
ncbi:hypothetical protein CA235_18345 [Sphingomonas sp. ABOLF]|uniref:hypothetical protein n=1 Tax=Sphingomonas sp. ABOLF TaxID=1985879 RepID=UPI000F7EC011|nr:hypothetical protein [Sphingomonas sp. ABOLF]RSV11632.1 hypothetical protein CA235_18345 [Sphingomonas sp. ABOLF]